MTDAKEVVGSFPFACLIVLDGWGEAGPGPGNAVELAQTPNLDLYFEIYPHVTLKASGEAVGLPAGQMGNSEVGHLNLGAGRVVYQDLTRINLAVADGSFFNNATFIAAMDHAREKDSSLHLIGLLSNGGVHSDIGHLKALISMAKQRGVKEVLLHVFLDGRDVPPRSGAGFVRDIGDFIEKERVGRIATVCGRYYAMDRDHRWDRTKKAYDAMVYGVGAHHSDPVQAVLDSYDLDVTDEFLIPTIIGSANDSRIREDDSLIFFNFRPDRARQLTKALTFSDFTEFDRGPAPPFPLFVSMSEYDITFDNAVAFPSEELRNVLAEVLSRAGKTQLHIAETEKYAHVTFFFNGGLERPFEGETRKLIPSPQDVATYDEKPAMSAREVTDELLRLLAGQHFDFVIVNYANCDMVGHTGDLHAAIEAVEVVDECVGRLVTRLGELGAAAIITSDHGNAENMVEPDGGPNTAHTTEDVPVIVNIPGAALRSDGALSDAAPTILNLIGIPVPAEMTGTSIITNI